MAGYDIYGIGAALVDTEVQVSNEFLLENGIDKGVMTLVDEPRQAELLNALAANQLQALRQSGGSVCNSIVAASCLGSRAFFSGKVANDADGDLYIEDLRRAGVDFQGAGQDPGVTGKCLVMVTPDAERSMNTFLGASECLGAKEIDQAALLDSQWFYIEGYLVTDEARTEAVIDAIRLAKAKGVKIALSLSDPFVVSVFADELKMLIGDGIDLIFCNRDEAIAFTGTNDLDSAAESLKLITETFAITDGANGAVTFDGDAICHTDAVPVVAVDSNGAGDMFAGAFLNRIISGKTYTEAAIFANACAAKVVTTFGPRLDKGDFDEINRRLGS